jgi:late competence protein required for DNA uptake (superfamily II DNA/RNA helicase)
MAGMIRVLEIIGIALAVPGMITFNTAELNGGVIATTRKMSCKRCFQTARANWVSQRIYCLYPSTKE